MTRKELILRMIGKLPDDVTYDRVMYHLDVMKAIEIGEEQIRRGEVIPHEEVFAELLGEDEKDKVSLDARRKRRSQKDSSTHRKGRPSNGQSVRTKTAKGRAKPAKVS